MMCCAAAVLRMERVKGVDHALCSPSFCLNYVCKCQLIDCTTVYPLSGSILRDS